LVSFQTGYCFELGFELGFGLFWSRDRMIEVEHLSKVYGSTSAISDVTFSVATGEILGFLGPNGAGKTTTMRILAGYLPATQGTAKIAGFEVHENSMAVRQRIGYLPETPPLYVDMTIEGFLNFVARIKGVSAGNRADRVQFALDRCNLLEHRQTLIRKLSKGFRQRVGIAQAIVHDPPVIILDEPTVGLDPKQIIDVRNLIRSLAGDHTVILSTHILPEVGVTCDRVAIINRGKIAATDTPENLMKQLNATATYELEVDQSFGQVQAALQKISGINYLELISESPTNQRVRLKIVPSSSADIAREINQALAANRIGLYEMKRSQASLEAAFLELTTEEPVPAASQPIANPPDNPPTEIIQTELSEIAVSEPIDSPPSFIDIDPRSDHQP
jgi:ABC-2 type transport system ATP-binding protein